MQDSLDKNPTACTPLIGVTATFGCPHLTHRSQIGHVNVGFTIEPFLA